MLAKESLNGCPASRRVVSRCLVQWKGDPEMRGFWACPPFFLLLSLMQRSLPRQVPSARVLLDLKPYLSLSRNPSSIDGLSISRSRSSQGCPAIARFLEKMLYSAHLNTPEPFCPHITSGEVNHRS